MSAFFRVFAKVFVSVAQSPRSTTPKGAILSQNGGFILLQNGGLMLKQ